MLRAEPKAKQTEVHSSLHRHLARHQAVSYTHLRPIFLVGPPGIGKTQIMEQIAKECRIGLVAYTITHHTRQSAVGPVSYTHLDVYKRQVSSDGLCKRDHGAYERNICRM